MKKEEFEKCISDLSPELQEKARTCKSMEEIYELIAENDVELSDAALEAVAGGCSQSSNIYNQGDPVSTAKCPSCGGTLYYWDMCHNEKGCENILRMYCNNPSCSSYNNGLWYCACLSSGSTSAHPNVYKY